ncbi:DUF3768 domain-containing protein [Rubellimicrobium aerolatum]|uniref:DUF3768 domain-containing protein n=1 Tax=Rubellimicrobium aerolatum TaxID=490979 RepID=A0ABW0SE44_9RHOB|nr:DUF3768 domain-containing protein [Rubellimicrobium aerolatum]MBP1807003.1 hypothetical protein [Rubellimicrobium aerolatum]
MTKSPEDQERGFDAGRLIDEAKTAVVIAEQNDRFRYSFGADPAVPGRIVVTQGVAALGRDAGLRIVVAVMRFADFSEDNDPHGWRDFGAFEIEDGGRAVRLYWKIDLYDADYRFGSEVPEDPACTRRVLTILLPDEW